MRRPGTVLCLAVLLALAWAAGAPAQIQAPSQGLTLRGVNFPDALGAFRRGRVQVATRTARQQGTSVDYVGLGATARVFLYGEVDGEADADSEVLRNEFKQVLAAAGKDAKRQGAATAAVRGVRKVRGADGRDHFLEAEMHVESGQDRRVAYIYLGSYRGQFVMVSVSSQARLAGTRPARTFITALSRQFWPAAEGEKPAEKTP